MIPNKKIVKKLRNDNILSLKVCIALDIQQSALFKRIERNSETLFNDIRVINTLKDNGHSEQEIFENHEQKAS